LMAKDMQMLGGLIYSLMHRPPKMNFLPHSCAREMEKMKASREIKLTEQGNREVCKLLRSDPHSDWDNFFGDNFLRDETVDGMFERQDVVSPSSVVSPLTAADDGEDGDSYLPPLLKNYFGGHESWGK